ncbi:class I SAM-dependent methyltransferase [Desulfotalea psychrophila]|uniref:Methyltransferase type 11 domain-containing protein n=1 Tax=Desulfotalea psychrophila (strain LSv54 / DSM 12343) TaxID=177439 RepID=Q6AIK9_DESPS|nr:class I SAM-dependent methyltransferase [Desulfotalea psychrophila]CAG37821.1 unknown protein [Desulfotalea psychrophila LSv54]
MTISPSIKNILICPSCQSPLQFGDETSCPNCGARYGKTKEGKLNFHLQGPKRYQTETIINSAVHCPSDNFFGPLQANPTAEVDLSSLPPIRHLCPALLSYMPRAKTEEAIALDIGCGKTQNRAPCQLAGYQYLGIDYREADALFLADAQALPLADNSIDFALSLAVLEHLPHPEIMLREAFRVLKNGARFIGSVAFLQPFHDGSYYHFTHLGLYSMLHDIGFEVELIAPSREYSVLIATSRQLFRKMDRRYSKKIIQPIIFLHKLWWKFQPISPHDRDLSEIKRLLKFSGAHHFVVHKKQ